MTNKKSTQNIRLAFILNLSFSVIELVGGLFTNSVAIITDSLHDFCDSLSIALSWILERKSEKKPDQRYTYGYGRFSVLGALITSTVLFASSLIALIVAIPRIMNPAAVHYDGVLILAVFGFAINGFAAYKTAKGRSLNEKAISLHLLEDVLGWAAVLITGLLMKIFDLPVLDPILSVMIALFMMFNVVKNIKTIFEVFLEKAPKGVNIEEITAHLFHNEAIKDIHHIHLWTLDGSNKYITLHVLLSDDIRDIEEIIAIKGYIKEELAEHGIHHSSIEFEFINEICDSHECDVETDSNSHFGHNHNH